MRMNEPVRMGCEACNKRSEMQFHRAVTPFPDDWAIAMAYVPMQTDTTAYELHRLCARALCSLRSTSLLKEGVPDEYQPRRAL